MRFVFHLCDKDQVQAVARFRMGVHWLNSEGMRKGLDGKLIPRSCRVCQCCGSGSREDEMHVLECHHYNEIRHRYQDLFPNDYGNNLVCTAADDHIMKMVMNGDGSRGFWNRFANFLLACKRSREKVIAPTGLIIN